MIQKLPNGLIIIAVITTAIATVLSGGVGLIGGIVGYFCGKYNYKQAKKHKKDGIVAFLVGQLFGLAGLFGYLIYLEIRRCF